MKEREKKKDISLKKKDIPSLREKKGCSFSKGERRMMKVFSESPSLREKRSDDEIIPSLREKKAVSLSEGEKMIRKGKRPLLSKKDGFRIPFSEGEKE